MVLVTYKNERKKAEGKKDIKWVLKYKDIRC